MALVWVKILYPRLSGLIEKIPPLTGKIVTWVITAAMIMNATLTAAAMLRYNTRKERPEAGNVLEELLDQRYSDERMEQRWPNMVVVENESHDVTE